MRVPKTASTSLSTHIQKNIVFESNDACFQLNHLSAKNIYFPESGNQHPTLEFAIKSRVIKKEEIDSMDVYGVMREPLSRTISLFANIVGLYKNRFGYTSEFSDFRKLTTNEIAETALNLIMKSSEPFKFSTSVSTYLPANPQTNWLKYNNKLINNIIIYPNFDNFLQKITPHATFNETLTIAPPHIKTELHDDLKNQIRNLYREDFDLWEQLNPPLL